MQNLNDDCLREIFLHLPPMDLLKVANVCHRWNSIALITWSSFRTLNMKDIPNVQILNNILRRVDSYVRVLNFKGCKNQEKSLKIISGNFSNLDRMEFDKEISIENRQLLQIFGNYKVIKNFINEDNILNVMRLGAKLMLHGPVFEATIKSVELEAEGLIKEWEVADLLGELESSPREFLSMYYNWDLSKAISLRNSDRCPR